MARGLAVPRGALSLPTGAKRSGENRWARGSLPRHLRPADPPRGRIQHGESCRHRNRFLGRVWADWFLLDSRTIRHVAVGLFCCGVSIYLTALAIYMLLLFEMETGITGACILSSGILVLLITVTHALVRAKQVARRGRTQLSHTLYENDSAQHGEAPARHLNNSKNVAGPRPRPEIHREFSYPPFLERKAPFASPGSSTVSSAGSPGALPEGSCSLPRTHRTLSAESGLLQVQGKPWNGVTQEMKNVLARKPVATGKDSTLV
ncbi:PREDICTED: transmembrane protein 221 [Gavialis gangeticus]|uniref:transmembrane protein 221 n=1 Tax=Gavialis gangeticus TaxID=94835 RepID=UPI00092F37CE|nr:PREDICTED: transmembrane protein 221 [Gavialis gangeticus]